MTHNEALVRDALLRDVRGIKGIAPKAMTEILLMRVAYSKAAEEFAKAREEILSDADAGQESKEAALAQKAAEEAQAKERLMTQESFGMLVEAAMGRETVESVLAGSQGVPTDEWLALFAAHLVEGL